MGANPRPARDWSDALSSMTGLTRATSGRSRIASASPTVSVSARPNPEGMFTASPPRM